MAPGHPVGKVFRVMEEVSKAREVWVSLLMLLAPQPDSGLVAEEMKKNKVVAIIKVS